MKTDPIVQEVRDARASIAAEFGYDLSKYLAWAREQTRLKKESVSQAAPVKGAKPGGAAVRPKKRRTGATA